MKRILLLSCVITLLLSCKAELTEEKALQQLKALPEFQTPFYAPFHIGREVLNGDDHKNPDKYIREHLGELIDAGLVEAKIVDNNSWRSVLELTLTEAGRAVIDPNRSMEDNVYVKSCIVTPTEITEMKVITEDKEIEVSYIFTVSEVTPFGKHLGFENGKTHKDSRRFVRLGMGWDIL